jgi:hypothetical protein
MIGARIQRQQIRADFKPDFDVRLRADHPLAGYLSSLTLPNAINPVDLVSGRMGWAKVGTIGPSISKAGTAVKGDGSTGYLSRSISLSGLRPHLILAVFEAVSNSIAGKTIYALGSNAASNGAYIQISNGQGTTNNILGQIRSLDGSGNYHNVLGPVVSVGSLYACAWYVESVVSTNNFLWVNGSSYTAFGNDLETSNGSTLIHETIGALKRGTVGSPSPDHILLIARGIPPLGTDLDAVLREWTQNPWDLLEPEQSRTIVLLQAGGTTKTLTDTGSGMDALAIAVAFGLADTGAGNDAAPGASAGLSLADTAASADIVSQIAAALTLPDTLTGTEALSLAALLGVADSGQGLDAVGSVAVSFALADLGAGADAVGLLQELLKTIADAGQGTDAVASITVTVPAIADTGAGADTVTLTTEALKTIADAGTGADAVAQMLVLAAIAETGAGLDQATIGVQLSLADAGSGLDQALTSVLIALSDLAAGSDGLTVSVSVPIPDAGSGLDALGPITALLALLDTVNATDVVIRIGEEFKQIVSIRFTFAARRVVFAWSARSVSFKLN